LIYFKPTGNQAALGARTVERRQTLDDVRLLARGVDTLRGDVLADLLKKCKNVKTVRLCLLLGSEFSHPWFAELDAKTLPRGSATTWVARSAMGTLVLKR
jgi:hypothetical protein